MSEKARNTKFIKRVWLNEPYQSTFLRVSDCHVSANIHKAVYDSDKEFIAKMKRIRDVIDEFITHLENEYND